MLPECVVNPVDESVHRPVLGTDIKVCSGQILGSCPDQFLATTNRDITLGKGACFWDVPRPVHPFLNLTKGIVVLTGVRIPDPYWCEQASSSIFCSQGHRDPPRKVNSITCHTGS